MEQGAERVVDHRFVIHRQQLFADCQSDPAPEPPARMMPLRWVMKVFPLGAGR